MNPTEEDTAVLHCLGITIDEDNDPASENVPEQQEQQKGNRQEGGEVWKSEGIICPRKAKNIQDYFSCFWNYTREEVLKKIELQLFLVFLTIGYLNTILISETKKVLKDPLDPGDFTMRVGFWFYMACQVGIPESREWWSVTPPVVHRGAPIRLNEYMYHH